eukprot:jgi/Ulvmu1/11697/UM008_0108.1
MEPLKGKHVIVTGGMGFIGSHTCVCLVEAGAEVTLVDNLSNSFKEVLNRLTLLLGESYSRITFREVDVTNVKSLSLVFDERRVDAVIHFAAFKAVNESIQMPLQYYRNNVDGTLSLLEVMQAHQCKTLVFSSSCTVYGVPERVPIDEECSLNSTTSPYGRTKVFNEEILRDLHVADKSWDTVLLRYFNPVAAHPSGLIGEHPIGVPQNLMPFVQQVAAGIRPKLMVFGNDYNTRDGTTIRDYIHVVDLAEAHVAALQRVLDTSKGKFGCRPINVGTGRGSTVLEMVAAMEQASGRDIPYEFADRREGDTEAVWAATAVAQAELGWTSRLTVEDMCRDQWKWAQKYPYGYESGPPKNGKH